MEWVQKYGRSATSATLHGPGYSGSGGLTQDFTFPGGKVPDVIDSAYKDTEMLVADPKEVAAWLPVDNGTQLSDHIYMVDPNGNLMMRFPKDPNPSKIKGDVTKLLKNSRIG